MMTWYRLPRRGALALAVLLLIVIPASTSQPAAHSGYKQTNLVSDVPGLAMFTDPNLVNAWGMSFGQPTFIWVSDNGTGVATLYKGDGTPQSLVVTIPGPGGTGPSAPTGQVFNDAMTGFELPSGGPALFIFVTEDGTISGWNLMAGTQAVLKVDRSGDGAVYKGVALNNNRLYAANFRFGTVEVFDANWTLVDSITDPNVPPGYAPFNIQNLGGTLYVTFAKQDEEREDDVAGPGHGFVDILTPNPATNTFTFTRLISGQPGHAPLNSPWGLALAPASGFGEFSGALLVGNFGDGAINAFNPNTGAFLGRLRHSHGGPVRIDGLWALVFGKGGANNGPTTTLFFTAGPNDETHGLFGKLEPVQ